MTTYTVPALNAVDFDITAATPDSVANHVTALSAYSVPALAAVAFALVAYTRPTFMGIDFELGGEPVVDPPTLFLDWIQRHRRRGRRVGGG